MLERVTYLHSKASVVVSSVAERAIVVAAVGGVFVVGPVALIDAPAVAVVVETSALLKVLREWKLMPRLLMLRRGSCRPRRAWTETRRMAHYFVRTMKIDENCCRQQQYHPEVAAVEMSKMFAQKSVRKLRRRLIDVVAGVPACWAW